MKSTLVYWFRWVAVLPGSLIGGFLWSFPLHWMLVGTLEHGETIFGVNIRPIEYALTPLVLNIGFTYTAYTIAPSRKLWATISFTYLWWLIILGALIYWSSSSDVEPRFEYRFLLGVLGAVIGIGIAWSRSKDEPTTETPYASTLNEGSGLGAATPVAMTAETTNTTDTPTDTYELLRLMLSILFIVLVPLGAVVSLGGLAVRAFSHTWTLFIIGLCIAALGIAAFAFMYVHLFLTLTRNPDQARGTTEASGEGDPEHGVN